MKNHIPTLDIKHIGNEEKLWGDSVTLRLSCSTVHRLSPRNISFPFNPPAFPAVNVSLYTPHYRVLL